LVRAKVASSSMHFQLGKRFLASEQLELAIAEFQQVLLLNPGHQYALNELKRAARALRERDSLPSEIEQLKERVRRRAGLGPPRLDPQANIPILLEFQMVKIGKIFEAIGKAAGINFIFDDKTDLDKELTIDIGNVTLEQALDILMLQTKNFYKPIDEYTLLVAPDTPVVLVSSTGREEYRDDVDRLGPLVSEPRELRAQVGAQLRADEYRSAREELRPWLWGDAPGRGAEQAAEAILRLATLPKLSARPDLFRFLRSWAGHALYAPAAAVGAFTGGEKS